jgi:hypothetical protein
MMSELNDAMSCLYKGLSEEEYEREFWKNGVVRVGTIAEYRDMLPPTGDQGEGRWTAQLRSSRPWKAPSSTMSRIMPENIQIRGGYVAMNGGFGSISTDYGNALLFCVSESPRQEFGAFGYVIVQLQSFGWALFEALRRHGYAVSTWRRAPVSYDDEPIIDGLKALTEARRPLESEAFFRKGTNYKSQREHRYVFLGSHDELPQAGITIRAPELRAYCRRR